MQGCLCRHRRCELAACTESLAPVNSVASHLEARRAPSCWLGARVTGFPAKAALFILIKTAGKRAAAAVANGRCWRVDQMKGVRALDSLVDTKEKSAAHCALVLQLRASRVVCGGCLKHLALRLETGEVQGFLLSV